MNTVDAKKLYDIATHYPFVVFLPNGEMYGVDSPQEGDILMDYERQYIMERTPTK